MASPPSSGAPVPPARTTVSVVVPVHNEASYVEGALVDLFADLDAVAVDRSGGAGELAVDVVVVENGSIDDTAEIADVNYWVPRQPMRPFPVTGQ